MTAVFAFVARSVMTPARAGALGLFGLLGVLLGAGVAGGPGGGGPEAAYDLARDFGIGLLTPLSALVLASSALGDPAEDGTLVYLWLRPLARSRLAAGAGGAALAATLPFAVAPTVAATVAAGGGGRLAVAAAAAAAVAAVAYTALFVWLGLVVRRALAWGVAYVVIWEGVVARSGTGAARLSVLSYARSLVAHLAGFPPPPRGVGPVVAVAVPLLVAAGAVAATVWSLRRIDVA